MFLSITGATPDNRLAKYQPFEVEADAIAHALEYNGFSIADPEGNQEFWIVNMTAKTVVIDTDTQASVTAAREMSAVRAKRDALLAATDWRFRSDQTPSQAWIDYCQALRDLPANTPDPLNPTWPTEPGE
tara:strand:- start:277 stop:666 length:390 start_codon:yes stop_codon:yes gene_type:complete